MAYRLLTLGVAAWRRGGVAARRRGGAAARRGFREDSIYWHAAKGRYVGAVSLGYDPKGKRIRGPGR